MKYITILSLTELLALVMGSFHTNETAPSVHLSYSSLRQDILSRPVAASRIPPTLETGYKERYALIFGSVVVNVQEFDEINQVTGPPTVGHFCFQSVVIKCPRV